LSDDYTAPIAASLIARNRVHNRRVVHRVRRCGPPRDDVASTSVGRTGTQHVPWSEARRRIHAATGR